MFVFKQLFMFLKHAVPLQQQLQHQQQTIFCYLAAHGAKVSATTVTVVSVFGENKSHM
jgi:hypothetical protein